MGKNSFCLIMAGGIGNRLWPISSSECPKQFCDILNVGKTLLRQTYERISRLFSDERILIITGQEYVNLAMSQVPEIPKENFLKEPYIRNTATCIAYAAYKLNYKYPDSDMVAIPSDNFITNDYAYINNIKQGFEYIKTNGGLMVFGKRPLGAETQYGYIQIKDYKENKRIYDVKTFTEKPNEDWAKMFYESGEFMWNLGIFIWKTKDIIKEFSIHMYDLHQLFTSHAKFYTSEEDKFIQEVYAQCHSISIDSGILEKSSNTHVLKGEFGWSDIGTWHSYYKISKKDKNMNTANNTNVTFSNSSLCMVNTLGEKKIIVQGINNVIIAESRKYIMICNKEDESKIRQFEKLFRLEN